MIYNVFIVLTGYLQSLHIVKGSLILDDKSLRDRKQKNLPTQT